jgi:hypothetical protein
VVLEVSVFDALLPRMSSVMTTTCSTRPVSSGVAWRGGGGSS